MSYLPFLRILLLTVALLTGAGLIVSCYNALYMIGVGVLLFALSSLVFGWIETKRPHQYIIDEYKTTRYEGYIFKGRPFINIVASVLKMFSITLLLVGGVSWLWCLFD